MNIMQTVRPAGNELLSKVEKIGIDPNFVKPSTGEEAVGKIFESILLSQVLRNMELVPSIELKTLQVSNILPIKVGDAETLVSSTSLSAYEEDGNLVKIAMLELEQHAPANLDHPDDPEISWSGSNGNKTCLRNWCY